MTLREIQDFFEAYDDERGEFNRIPMGRRLATDSITMHASILVDRIAGRQVKTTVTGRLRNGTPPKMAWLGFDLSGEIAIRRTDLIDLLRCGVQIESNCFVMCVT